MRLKMKKLNNWKTKDIADVKNSQTSKLKSIPDKVKYPKTTDRK
jgi:hypothetical protein